MKFLDESNDRQPGKWAKARAWRVASAAATAMTLLACKTEATIAKTPNATLTVKQIREKIAAMPPPSQAGAKANIKPIIYELLETDVMVAEAKRTNLTPPQTQVPTTGTPAEQETAKAAQLALAMKNKIADDIKAGMTPQDVTDEEIFPLYQNNPRFPYYPERAMVVGVIFKRATDGQAFAKEAAALKEKSEQAFRELYSKHARRIFAALPVDKEGQAGVETWDFDVTRQPFPMWPKELAEPAFKGKPGDIVGPITGVSERYKGPRTYVLRIQHVMPESNSFQQAKDRLRESAFDLKVLRAAEKEIRARVEKAVTLDEKAIEKLQQELAGSVPPTPPGAPGTPPPPAPPVRQNP